MNNIINRRKAIKLLSVPAIATVVPFPVIAGKGTIFPVNETTEGKKIYHAYRSFWPELEMTANFGKMGINTRCFFAANTINSLGFDYCKYLPIWKGIKDYDFSAYEKQVEDLLSANPEADFMCLIDLNTPPWLTRRLVYDSFSEISHAASDKRWLDITTEWMKDFISYSEGKYGK